MPGMPAPVADEREGLLAFLAQQRAAVIVTSYGLTDEQARQTPATSALSVGGLIKHLTAVERHWLDMVVQRPKPIDDIGDAEQGYEDGFRLGPDETLAGVIADYELAAKETEAAVAGIADLGQAVPVPQGVPWFPADVEAWSVRWVLLHLIEETARHAGHADMVREAIDGATGFELLAAAEGWPATDWLQPWEPATAS